MKEEIATQPKLTPLAERLMPLVEAQTKSEREEDRAATEALSEPMPGPLGRVFTLVPGIKVGKWTVRRFADIDYYMLKDMRHSFSKILKKKMVEAGMDGGTVCDDLPEFYPTGPDMWQLAWIFTRGSSRECEDLVKQSGSYDALKLVAKEEFDNLQMAALLTILEAIFKQVNVYWSANLEYEADKGKESANATANPTE
jgi:hypothetical protein